MHLRNWVRFREQLEPVLLYKIEKAWFSMRLVVYALYLVVVLVTSVSNREVI